MSSLGDRLYREVVGSEPATLGTFAEQLAELARRYGSQRKLAEAVGVHRKTLYNWTSGKNKPRTSTLARVARWVREARLDPASPGDKTIELRLTETGRTYKHDGAERTVDGKQLGLRAGTMRRVREAYAATGDPEKMAAAFVAGITVPFYRIWLGRGVANELAPAGPADAPEPGDDDEDQDVSAERDALDDLYEDWRGPDIGDVPYDREDDPADGDPGYALYAE